MKLNDYVIMQLDDKKKHFVLVTKVAGDSVNGVLASRLPYDTETIKFTRDDIVCSLGPAPEAGRVYGTKVEPFIRTASPSSWGDVHYFVKLKKDLRVQINEHFNVVGKALEKKGLVGFFPLKTEIRPKAGKYAGSYKYNGKDKEDVFTLHPKEWNVEEMSYVIYHESGHGVWFRMLTNKQRADWIKFYHTIVTHKTVEPKTLSKIRARLTKGDNTVSSFKKELDEELVPVYAHCLKYVRENHNLNAKHLDTILEEGDDLKEYWPTSILDLKELKTDITEYSTKSPEEFFAEAFAFHMVGKKLPKYIAKKLEETLTRAGRAPKKGKEE